MTASSEAFLERSTEATLALLVGPHGTGCFTVAAWQRFGDWMTARGLLKTQIPAAEVADPSFLPRRCR